MTRKLRIEYPGAMYHRMSRGDRREKIFLDYVDRQDFHPRSAEYLRARKNQILISNVSRSSIFSTFCFALSY